MLNLDQARHHSPLSNLKPVFCGFYGPNDLTGLFVVPFGLSSKCSDHDVGCSLNIFDFYLLCCLSDTA